MSSEAGSIDPLEPFREQAVAALMPFFNDGTAVDPNNVRLAAHGLLDDYHAATPRELQLATQVIALSWAVMACLRAAVAAQHLSLDDMLRLQGDAIALERLSHAATKTLKARRKDRAKNAGAVMWENTTWDEGAFQLATGQALEKLTDANARLAGYRGIVVPVRQKVDTASSTW